MDIYMFVKWLKFLCLMTAFCARSTIFGARLVLGFANLEEFKNVKSCVYATNSTLALYTCFCLLWGTTYCHIPCLLRHTVHAESVISKAAGLEIMRILNFLKSVSSLTPSPRGILIRAMADPLPFVCYDMLWNLIRILSLFALHLAKKAAFDLIISIMVVLLITK